MRSREDALAAATAAGLGEDPVVSVRQAVEVLGASERTIRRYIASRELATEEVKARRGKEHRFKLTDLLDLAEGKATGAAVPTAMDAVINEIGKLRDQLAEQTRTIDGLRAEVRDARAQTHQLQEQLLKALPAPRKPFWSRFRKG